MGRTRLSTTDYTDTWPTPLRQAARRSRLDHNASEPIIVRMEEPQSATRLEELADHNPITSIKDNYDEQLSELFLSENAQLYRANSDIQNSSIADYLAEHYHGRASWQLGSWVYYPWSGELVHIVAQDLFERSRTIRNRDLITAEEQQRYGEIRVGCAGLSVGSSAAVALVLQGASKRLKITDGAVISGSNLNRIRAGIGDIGHEKGIVIARQLYEMNPYIELSRSASITTATLEDFFAKPWALDVVVDEIDDLEIKIRLRVEARRRRIPVLMATDLGDDVMLDVERFDQNPESPLFHGLAGKIEEVLGRQDLTQRQWLKYATTIIGSKNVPLRMQQSLLKVGSSLPTQPQLGGTAMMAGVVLAYAVRHLALSSPLKSGRHTVSLDHDLLRGHTGFGQKRRHSRHTKILDRALKSM